jgi:hypothetical protein
MTTIVAAVVALRVTGAYDLPPIELASVLNLLLWFVIGFLIFAVLFGAAGSLVSRSEDANTIAMPMSMSAVVGFFVSITALNDPDGPVAVVSTFIPLTAPFVVPVRTALEAIPAWQYIAALIICLASIVVSPSWPGGSTPAASSVTEAVSESARLGGPRLNEIQHGEDEIFSGPERNCAPDPPQRDRVHRIHSAGQGGAGLQ